MAANPNSRRRLDVLAPGPISATVQSYTVLMIEDSVEYAQVLAEVLELADQGTFHITVESCLAAGLKALAEETCDVILLDLGLTGQSRTPDADER